LLNTDTKAREFKFDSIHYIKALFELMKPRVMSLAIFTCVVGFLITPYKNVDYLYAILSITAVALGSGAAGSLNCWYEADVDKVMSRTCLRPIPTGKLTKNEALIFGILSSFVSVGALYFFSNFIAAALLALTILFYVFVYTIWLKRKTPQNIVIGGAAGALPPVIGWAIATGGISIEPIILFLIIFVWTPSHFWALSLFKSEDYKKANIPMLPVTSGVETTKKNIFAYSILLFPVAVAPYYLEFLGVIYLLFSFPLSAYYVFICYKLLKTKEKKSEKSISKQIFAFSILYLFAIFISILVDKFA
jgi:protoheme IX farnesyltransferase